MTLPDLRKLCARMADELDHYRQLLMDDRRETHALAAEARALLAQPKPPADREVAELVAWLRTNADYSLQKAATETSKRFHRVADLLERLAQPKPQGLPPGYIDSEHTGHDRKLLETFYRACRSEGGTADEINLRGLKAVLAQPEPQGPSEQEVSEWINSLPLWHGATRDELTGIVLRALARWGRTAIEPVPVAWCRSDEFVNAMKRGGSFNGWKDPGAGANKCDMQLYTIQQQEVK
jgi:hypothetical protein